jgi:copper homeostasis protein
MTSLAHVLVEICVDSLASAVAADRGGADRVELCAQLEVGGVTPAMALVRAVRSAVKCKLHVLIRPRPGDFAYGPEEIATMARQIDEAKALGADGVVLGVLDRNRQVDVPATRDLVQRARPLPVTFHRAFDQAPECRAALEAVIDSGCAGILTSGGAKSDGAEFESAVEGAANLRALTSAAAGRILILAGGGIRAGNVRPLVESTGVSEVHSSLSVQPAAAKNAVPKPSPFVVHEYQVKQFVAAARKPL